MTDLIQRCETAQTREEAVAVFRAFKNTFKGKPPAHFGQFYWDAVKEDSDERCLGYLLLAAMAVVPEGFGKLDIMIVEGGHTFVATSGGLEPVYDSEGHFSCTALLAAILKANEAKDDR